jgi:hypothetical protein
MKLLLLIHLVHWSVGVFPAVQDCKDWIDTARISEESKEDCRQVLLQEIGYMDRRIHEETETLQREIANRERHLAGLRSTAGLFRAVSEAVIEGHDRCNDERVSYFYTLFRRDIYDEWIQFAERETIPTPAETSAWTVEIVARYSRQAEETRTVDDRAEFVKAVKLALGPIIARIDDGPAEHPQITQRKSVIRELTRDFFFANEYLSQL